MLASVIVSEVDPTYILAKTVYIKKVLSIIKGLVPKSTKPYMVIQLHPYNKHK